MDNGASSYRRFCDGDRDAFSDLVIYYKDGLILYLNGYVNNLYLAEDLTEDTFFRLLVKKPKFSGKSSFKSWLYAIGRHIAVDYIRRNSKLPAVPMEDMENYLSDALLLEQSYIKEESKIAVHRAMRQLTAGYRTVLWLSYFEDFTNQEIASILRKNDRQVTNLLYRAKQSLKTALEKEGFQYENQS